MTKPTNNIYFFLLVLLFSACGLTNPTAYTDYAHLYSINTKKPEVTFSVYHHADNRSTLYISYSTQNLLFAKPLNKEQLLCNIKVFYQLFSDTDKPIFLDSGSFFFYHPQTDRSFITDSIVFACGRGNHYLMDVTFIDLNKKSDYNEVIYIDKSNYLNEQNFIIKYHNQPINRNSHLSSGDTICFYYTNTNFKKCRIKVFTHDFPIATPPYSMEKMSVEYKPDYEYIVPINGNSINTFILPFNGYYLLTVDSLTNLGSSIQAFGKDFPEIKLYADMIPPLRYLCTRSEFDELVNTTEYRKAVENFWIDLSGNKERARELIKQYYNRVQWANRYFTSYKPGWKTDRGMIYLVFGAPNFVNRSKNTEIWTYGELNNYRSLTFIFNKNENSINANDFILERNPLLKDSWMQAVDVWRQGRVYNPYN